MKGQVGDKTFTQMEAIINSMTPKERARPEIIKGSRKKRIAAGSGTQVQDINKLLKQFTQMQKMMKKMKGKGGMQKNDARYERHDATGYGRRSEVLRQNLSLSKSTIKGHIAPFFVAIIHGSITKRRCLAILSILIILGKVNWRLHCAEKCVQCPSFP